MEFTACIQFLYFGSNSSILMYPMSTFLQSVFFRTTWECVCRTFRFVDWMSRVKVIIIFLFWFFYLNEIVYYTSITISFLSSPLLCRLIYSSNLTAAKLIHHLYCREPSQIVRAMMWNDRCFGLLRVIVSLCQRLQLLLCWELQVFLLFLTSRYFVVSAVKGVKVNVLIECLVTFVIGPPVFITNAVYLPFFPTFILIYFSVFWISWTVILVESAPMSRLGWSVLCFLSHTPLEWRFRSRC